MKKRCSPPHVYMKTWRYRETKTALKRKSDKKPVTCNFPLSSFNMVAYLPPQNNNLSSPSDQQIQKQKQSAPVGYTQPQRAILSTLESPTEPIINNNIIITSPNNSNYICNSVSPSSPLIFTSNPHNTDTKFQIKSGNSNNVNINSKDCENNMKISSKMQRDTEDPLDYFRYNRSILLPTPKPCIRLSADN